MIDTALMLEQCSRMYPKGLTAQQAEGLAKLLRSMEDDDLLLTWRAYKLATVKHECANTWQPITERGPRTYFNKYETGTKIGRALGNTQPGDGFLFRGRGYVQLTGRANYEKMTVAVGSLMVPSVDYVANPDLLLTHEHAYAVMAAGMLTGAFTGKSIRTYVPGPIGGTPDYVNARRVINGLDCAEKIAGYAREFEEMLTAARR